jgi:phytoene synthase
MAELAPAPDVIEAYAHCAGVTRASGSSFASAFWMFQRPRRRALHAIYAFCRLADDIADDPDVGGDRRALLARWRAELHAAYHGAPRHPVGLALSDAARRFELPEELFLELLEGVATDLEGAPMESFEDLRRYCHRVASTVGLLVVRVLGARGARVFEYADNLGTAVQLTNVLRDVGQDAAQGRIYLAREDLARLGVSEASLRARRMTEEIRLLLAFYAERARLYYDRAACLLPDEERWRLRPAEAMGRIYRDLLEELQSRGFPCLGTPLRLSSRRRLAIAAATWVGRGVLAPQRRRPPGEALLPADRWAPSGQR